MRRSSALFAGGMLALSTTLLGSSCDNVRTRNSLPPGARVDTFNQVTVGKVDVLFVIDNSQSTEDKQDNLARNISGFFEYLTEAKVDYHVGVTTTDVVSAGPGAQGRLFGTPAVITPDTPDPIAAFKANAKVGTSGTGNEAGLDAARRTLELKPAGFLRPDAYLFLVFVSDDEDHSEPGVPRFFYRYFEQQKGKGNEGMISAGAIVGDSPNGCLIPEGTGSCKTAGGCTARAALRYKEVVDLVGGRTGSICDPQFDQILKDLGVDAVGLKRKFQLSKAPDESTLDVTIKYPCGTDAAVLANVCEKTTNECDGTEGDIACTVRKRPDGGTDGWSFEPATLSLIFNGKSLPPKGSEVDVIYYEPGQKPQ